MDKNIVMFGIILFLILSIVYMKKIKKEQPKTEVVKEISVTPKLIPPTDVKI